LKYKLSPQQLIIFQCIALEWDDILIAEKLGISVKTLNIHKGRAFKKLNLKDRKQAAEWIKKNHLLITFEEVEKFCEIRRAEKSENKRREKVEKEIVLTRTESALRNQWKKAIALAQ